MAAMPVMASVAGSHSLPPIASSRVLDSGVQPVAATFISARPVELVSSVSSGCNLQILYRYTRSIHLYSDSMTTIELTFINNGSEDLTDVRAACKVSIPL